LAEEETAPQGDEEAEDEAEDTSEAEPEFDADEPEVERAPKLPVRYHLTLKGRDLYLLVFGAALVIFAAFTLGAIVGRYLGPYPDQSVTAKLEREDLFKEEAKQEAATETPQEAGEETPQPTTADKTAKSETEARKKKEKPVPWRVFGSPSQAYELPSDTPSASPIPSPAKSPEAKPTLTKRPTPKAISEARPSPKPKRTPRLSPSPTPKKTPKAVSVKKAPAVKRPAPSGKKPSTRTYFAIQLGAYKSHANAQAEVRKLKRLGFKAWLKPVSNKARLYLVLVGRKNTAADYDATARKLVKQGYKDLWIRRFSESQ